MEEPTRERGRTDVGQVLDQAKRLIHEGNVRHVVITRGGETVAEIPLTFGVVGAIFAPYLVAAGIALALVTGCSIAIRRVEGTPHQ
ncbi:MAG TPA: DUF4342 domain-containing protein [Chloroflexota bacterium]